ncbi:hypothetical protein Rxycam_00018 [Rubrobacter xylanophilus DSM 9941]|uniref:mechanosensitive ion channel family protein n=1 Tax=Rubrobacter xylanophilus TaxID=49319 RepID=UPI001C6422E0|nr:mechanosensitive ion channel domain-containing protein [Rubrobacter xylanophilus]QYJ14222.1 hypothetical protein Rxycam_00018 [Rubrobacter xylanophilus DSM 9941]
MEQLISDLIAYVPRVLGALTIVAVGFVLGNLARPATTFALRRFRFDTTCERVGVTTLMRESGISSSPSRFAGLLVFWAILLFAVLAALGPLGLQFLAETLNQVILYVPRLVVATLILLLGTSAARVISEFAARHLIEVGVDRTGPLKTLIRFGIIFIATVLAASVLGIEATILVVVAVIGMGGAVLTAALAMGLGLRQLSQNVAAGRYISEGIKEGDEISVNGISGTVERIGYAMTVVRDADSGDAYFLPNSYFLEHAVRKRTSSMNAAEE